jgi:hypothetical protein
MDLRPALFVTAIIRTFVRRVHFDCALKGIVERALYRSPRRAYLIHPSQLPLERMTVMRPSPRVSSTSVPREPATTLLQQPGARLANVLRR